MLKKYLPEQRRLTAALQREALKLCDDFDDFADEDDFTSQLIGEIKRTLGGRRFGRFSCRAQIIKTKWRGKDSEEKVLGADLILSLHLNEDGVEEDKAYLIQAKMNEGEFADPLIRDIDRLRRQAETMIGITPESYVWAYADDGIGVYRAGTMAQASLVGAEDDLVPLKFGTFFARALRCQTGDYALGARARTGLRALAEELRADALAIAVSTGDEPVRFFED